ncbi:MAG: uracil-DNA glycosylase family protein [Candidatus Dormibacteria bacterium]
MISKSPDTPGKRGSGLLLERLHAQIAGCRRCVGAGLLEVATPVLPAPLPAPVVLVGQAPGRLEVGSGLPFSGRAGKQLFRWLDEAGAGAEPQAREAIYLTSMTKCFPGPAGSGAGDRRPSTAEVQLCCSHLDGQLDLLRPRLLVAVGQLAIARFVGVRPMDQLVGRVFDGEGRELELHDGAVPPRGGRPWVLPLPHPSGASRWLNQPGNQRLLARALARLALLLVVLRADP